jgi:hypothetical protein
MTPAGDDAARNDHAAREGGVRWGHPQPHWGHLPAAKRRGGSRAIGSNAEERFS